MFTDIQIKEIKQMVEEGKSLRAIADAFGISRPVLELRLARSGYQIKRVVVKLGKTAAGR